MATKPLDILGETHMPDDLFTNTDGLNWMLDTYPDLGKGMGVLDHETLGDPKQAPTLPDGIVVDAADGDDMSFLSEDQIMFGDMGDIGDMTKEAGLTDLSWLELAEQDPERLPDNPVDNGIPELEQAWGTNRRTTGILPNVDREAAAYEASLSATASAARTPMKVAVEVARQASRKVAAGASFVATAKEVAAKLGKDAYLIKGEMNQLKDDAGLIGRVFIRASDYPGCANGNWTEAVKKQAATATYVVQKRACEGCIHAQNGSCAALNKKIVALVPWDEALRRYTPALEASGRKVASAGNSKEALRRAFAQAPSGLPQIGDARPTHVADADRVGGDEARKALAAAPAFSVSSVDVPHAKALSILAKWHTSGALSKADHDRLAASEAPGQDILRTAAKLISAGKQGSYSGGLNAGKMGYEASREEAWAALSKAGGRMQQANDFIREEAARRERAASREGKRVVAIERKVAAVRQQIDMGLRGKALIAHIVRSFEAVDRGLALTILDPYIKAKNALVEPKAVNATYSGLTNDTRAQAHQSEVTASEAWTRLAQVHSPSPLDLAERQRMQAQRKLLGTLGRWVRDGLLSKSAAERLAHSEADPRDVVRVAAALVGRSRVAQYSGVANDARVPEVSPEQAWQMLAAAENKVKAASAKVAEEAERRVHAASRAGKREASIKAKVAKVAEAINRGLRGEPLLNLIRKVVAKDELAEVSKQLDPLLKKTGALNKAASAPREFQGTRYERAPTDAPRVASGPAHGETARLMRWARQQMNDGVAGRDLDHLLEGRFASSIRTAATSALRTLRDAHEGLAGHLYVDAEAYASKVGTEGCEKGALRHRANTIPNVLQMDRCASCSLRVAKADGTPVCSVYNKSIIASAAQVTDDPKAYQAEMVRLSNGTDADRVAAMFSNAYDPSEFQLGEDGELDNLRLADTPENEVVGDIFFGGMEVESSRPTLNLTGQRFGRLLVLTEHAPGAPGRRRWVTRCDCGVETIKLASNLIGGVTHSCGCLQREASAKAQRRYVGNPALNFKVTSVISSAKRRRVLVTVDRIDIATLLVLPCFYCGAPPANEVWRRGHSVVCGGIDRVDNARGYEVGNIVPCCEECNMAKRTMSAPQFLAWAKRVYLHSQGGQ